MRIAPGSGFILLAFVAATATGCGKDERKETADNGRVKAKEVADSSKSPEKDSGKKELGLTTKHDGWWCQEHGVPEHICSLCSAEMEAKFKKEGDWCKLHDRAKSQCFKCDPTLYKKFEGMYVAKYNKKPEPPPRAEFEK